MSVEYEPQIPRRQSEFGSLLNIAAGVLITFALTTYGAPRQMLIVAAVLAAAALVPCATVGRIFSLVLLVTAILLAYNSTPAR